MRYRSNRPKVCATFERYWLAALGCLLALGSLDAQAAWDAEYFNPMPQEQDVVLPMPCDGSMVFRKINVPAAKGPLDDYSITLGQDSDEWGYLEQARPTQIAGSFADNTAKSTRYYLLAKYELSQLQYQAVMADNCPVPALMLRLPQTGVSWFDATHFADKYTLWLRKNAAKALPKEDDVAGFLRLPTEVEWEFAARGGIAVSAAEFRDMRFPTPEGLNAYAWFAGSQSANGKLQLGGLLKPNPVGLHDMLGNVEEMTFEPFHLNKLNRQHGQAGGFILRGGSYLTPQADLRTSMRHEQPYYSNTGSEQSRFKTSGFRLALVAPTLTSLERVKQIESDWKTLGVRPETASSEGQQSASKDPVKEITSIAAGVEDNALKLQLEQLRSDLRANTLARDEQRDHAIRSELQLGTFLCTKMKDDAELLDLNEKLFKMTCAAQSTLDKSTCPARRKRLDEQGKVLDFLQNYYADTVVNGALNYSQATVEPQVGVVAQQMAARGKNNLRTYLDTYWNHLQGYMQSGKVARSHWLEKCKSIPTEGAKT